MLTGCAHLGDAGFGQPPEHSGVGETEAAGSGAAAVPGEPVAPGRAGRYPAAAPAQRAGRGSAGGGKEAPGVPGAAPAVRRRWAHHGKRVRARLPGGGSDSWESPVMGQWPHHPQGATLLLSLPHPAEFRS